MKCRVCGCTHFRPCEPPCGWQSPGLCTTCASAVMAIGKWHEEANRASVSALIREFRAYVQEPFVALSKLARGARR